MMKLDSKGRSLEDLLSVVKSHVPSSEEILERLLVTINEYTPKVGESLLTASGGTVFYSHNQY